MANFGVEEMERFSGFYENLPQLPIMVIENAQYRLKRAGTKAISYRR